MSSLPVALRVKRRRDSAAPAEIILEANSRAVPEHQELAASLRRSLGVSEATHQVPAASDGPVKKRCRFVLVSGTAAADSQVAGQDNQELVEGPVLELWHTSGLSAAAVNSHSTHAAPTGHQRPRAQGQHSDKQDAIYADMLQEYLQEQKQHEGSEGATSKQQHSYHRPSKRAQRSTANQVASTSTAGEQNVQDRSQQLPVYMTKSLLKHYGLWEGMQPDQQQHATQAVGVSSTAAPAVGITADQHQHTAGHAAGRPASPAAAAGQQGSDSMDWTYDVYVAADWEGSTIPEGDTDAGAGSSLPGGSQAHATGPEGSMHKPVIQVWDDELEQLQYDWATAQAGADLDSEDSNAEDHYANDYPDEDDCSYHDSLDSSDAEDEPAAGRYDVTERIGFYQPDSSSKGPRSRARDGRDESYAGADESSEFDVDDYESSGDGEEGGREEQGPSWLRKHCTAYAGGDGGQAWRAVLAQQFAPGPSH